MTAFYGLTMLGACVTTLNPLHNIAKQSHQLKDSAAIALITASPATDTVVTDIFTNWNAKVSGTFDAPFGIRLSPAIRLQSGAPFARTFQARLNDNSAVTIQAEPVGAERLPNVTILDLRTQKIFKMAQATFGLFLDVYNITNTNAEQLTTTTSGSAFLRPTAITSPRIARVGVKFNF